MNEKPLLTFSSTDLVHQMLQTIIYMRKLKYIIVEYVKNDIKFS